MGLGKAVLANSGKAALTPIIGLGLMGVAAHDAITNGVIGTTVVAGDLIGKTEKQKIESVSEATELQYYEESEAHAERKEATQIEVFDPDACDFNMLRKQYVDKGIPFILRRKGGAMISEASPPEAPDESVQTGNISVMSDSMSAKFPGIDEIIKKVLPSTWRAYWPLWFQGNYKSGLAHVDLGPGTCNFYFLKRGKKDVIIAPYEVTRELKLKTGIDNLYIPGSSGNHDYLGSLDKYYRVMLEEQSILIFNNAGCLHHFTNVIEEGITPIALSVRCKHALGSDPRGWLHLALDLKVWWNMTDHVAALAVSGADSRPQAKA